MVSILTAAALLSLGVLVFSQPTGVNIHLKLSPSGEDMAISYDAWLHDRLPNDGIWLATVNQPHVTLYLTLFDESNLTALQNR